MAAFIPFSLCVTAFLVVEFYDAMKFAWTFLGENYSIIYWIDVQKPFSRFILLTLDCVKPEIL